MKLIGVILLFSLLTVLCSEDAKDKPLPKKPVSEIVSRDMNARAFSQGQKLYQQNCATCHGAQGEGAKDWRTADKDGKLPPPPLNGNGHTWHHSPKALALVIREGTGKIGGNMPAWKDKLSNDEIHLILSWITAQWPDEIYTAWYNQHYQQN